MSGLVPSRPGLTAKQAQLLDFIKESIQATGSPPSFEAMASGVGLASKSGVHRLLGALEERGYITRMRHRARALSIVSDLAHIPAYKLIAELRERGIPVQVVAQ